MQLLPLAGLSLAELTEFVEGLGEPAYRARQIFAGLHHRRLRSFAARPPMAAPVAFDWAIAGLGGG